MIQMKSGEPFSLVAEEDLSFEKPFIYIRKTFPGPHSVRLHYHSSLEINRCTGMRGKIFIEGRSISLEEADLIILPPGTLHSYSIPECGGRIEVFHFSIDGLAEILNPESISRETGQIRSRPGVFLGSDRGLSLLLDGFAEGLPSPLRAASAVLLALDLLPGEPGAERSLGENRIIREIVRFTEESYSRPIGLADAASRAGFSPSYFCRFFKAATGLTYSEYLRDVRLERAASLLRGEGMSITEIGINCGFYDASHFIRVFRGKYGVSPGKMRR